MNLTDADASLPLIKGCNENGKGIEARDIMSLAFVLSLLKASYTSQKITFRTPRKNLF